MQPANNAVKKTVKFFIATSRLNYAETRCGFFFNELLGLLRQQLNTEPTLTGIPLGTSGLMHPSAGAEGPPNTGRVKTMPLPLPPAAKVSPRESSGLDATHRT